MRRALLLVDVINEFFHSDGVNYHSEYDEILDQVKRVLILARKHQLMIVHIRENHLPEHHHDFEFEKLLVHSTSDSSAIEWAPGIEVLENEFIVEKRRFSGFFETGLNLLLREAQIDQVIIVGVKTHVCIRATTEDAFGWGYHPILVSEAVGSNYHHLHEASLEDIQRYMGTVLTYDELENILKEK